MVPALFGRVHTSYQLRKVLCRLDSKRLDCIVFETHLERADQTPVPRQRPRSDILAAARSFRSTRPQPLAFSTRAGHRARLVDEREREERELPAREPRRQG